MARRRPKQLSADLDIPNLGLLFDKTKAGVFMGRNASFFGSLLCSMNFYWTADIKTAATDGRTLMWNPYWFLKMGAEERKTVLMHELWHPARLHHIRRGDRDPQIWNIACDHRINNDLLADGYSFKDLKPCLDINYKNMVEEDIYEDLLSKPRHIILVGSWTGMPLGGRGVSARGSEETEEDDEIGDGDMLPGQEEDDPTGARVAAVSVVVQAQQVAQMSGESGDLDQAVSAVLKQFLAPIVPWDVYLHRFMKELTKGGRTWARPNRRFPSMYLPSNFLDKKDLEHLVFIEDVSGSISDRDALRFNSEVKFVKDSYDPKKLTLVQFDEEITQVKEFSRKDKFEQIEIIGRRGTDLAPVRQWIIDNRPTAAIIFSDLGCPPMEPLPFNMPIIWVTINNPTTKPAFGVQTHIRG
jgi:predicted metal-dependent peptidase